MDSHRVVGVVGELGTADNVSEVGTELVTGRDADDLVRCAALLLADDV